MITGLQINMIYCRYKEKLYIWPWVININNLDLDLGFKRITITFLHLKT